MPELRRIAVVNRGEAAMRLLRAVRDFNAERGTRLQTIALYTTPDRQALFVREADDAFDLGAPTFVDRRDGATKVRYLDFDAIERALRHTGADAVWTGWGFVAERPDFVELCEALGVAFIGPSAASMRSLGDKIASKRLAELTDVPVVPWSGGAVDDPDVARNAAERLGYPLLVKATAGGGGRGIREVRRATELAAAVASARAEAMGAFGDGRVYLEKLVTGARHVEVQIIGDGERCWALGVRDCTLQRRHQKVLEETPSPSLGAAEANALCSAAARLCEHVGYRSAGTVEFLFDPRTRAFSFMEVNARLQVEHPITEIVTGVDLVKLQLHVALGGRLEGDPPPARGHAVEVRLNAEDPDAGFTASPGRVALLRLPSGPGIRVDTGIEEGSEIPEQFDSMVAKIVAHGRDRVEAFARLGRALAETAVVLEGGLCNKALLLDLLSHTDVCRNVYDVAWLDRHADTLCRHARPHAGVALLAAAIDGYERDVAVERSRFLALCARGRPLVQLDAARQVELRFGDRLYTLGVRRLAPERYRVTLGESCTEATVDDRGHAERRLTIGGTPHRVRQLVQGITHLVEVDGVAHRLTRDSAGVVRAPTPGIVLRIDVQPGDTVHVGDRLLVLEAMKMEHSVEAAFAGTVRELLVRPNVQVGAGSVLLSIDACRDETPESDAPAVNIPAREPGETGDDPYAAWLDELHTFLLGYDADVDLLRRMERAALEECGTPTHAAREDELLALFADISSLFRRRPDPAVIGDGGELEAQRSAQEYLITYLKDLNGRARNLPPSFVARVARALVHFGIGDTGLERTAELEESLFRIVRSHQFAADQARALSRLLQRRLTVEAPPGSATAEYRELLDRVIAVTQNVHPALNEVAREIRYRVFEQRMLESARRRAYVDADAHVAALSTTDASERALHVQALVTCPQPLHGTLAARFDGASAEMRAGMLEVMTRRYYRLRSLEHVRVEHVDGQPFVLAEYDRDGTRLHLRTTQAPLAHFRDALRTLGRLTDELSPDHVVADFYLWSSQPLDAADTIAAGLQRMINEETGGIAMRRLVVVLTAPESGTRVAGKLHFTFRASPSGYWEERLYEGVLPRGLHPMMAERLHLRRLENFTVQRLPSAEDVYLVHAVAKHNPSDERLFGIAEVRDVTPLRDDSGRVVHLPHLEHMLMEVLSGIRRFQADRSEERRLHWNRVLLHVWPSLALVREEIDDIVRKLAPMTEGLGLEAVIVNARLARAPGEEPRATAIRLASVAGGIVVRFEEPSIAPIPALGDYEQHVLRLRQRGLVSPYEIVSMLAGPREETSGLLPPGEFEEWDLDPQGVLVPVRRAFGRNTANIVVGVIRSFTAKYPDGMERVILLGDPTRGMGNLAEPECRRIEAALALAERRGVPCEWFAISAGAKIAMDSGTENMDWIALVLRRIVEFTQGGGELNVIVVGINVGAQPYWNAEATMLMHTRGILVMTGEAAMVLTGKQALDFSGGVSADDNVEIGGYEHVMGPNGQAQYRARDLMDACDILLRHYEHTYILPPERLPRRAATTDPADRDVREVPHGRIDGAEFDTVGDVFSNEKNPGRKKPFDVRRVMRALTDQDHQPLERWEGMQGAEIAVVWDAHIGGYAACLIGLESRPLTRLGFIPADGPDVWTGGTLFPRSSKKVARAINAASGNRPVVVLANLSGFDGSPESMRNLQLEYGAEIGRAVVNFSGPMVFVVIARYHGGAFVVFSNRLRENMEVAAVDGSYASVIGGAPAAAVVFGRDVRKRARDDARVRLLDGRIAQASGAERVRLQAEAKELFDAVYAEKLGEVAAEFDQAHSVFRARQVGSVHQIIRPERLRPFVIGAIERGLRRELGIPQPPRQIAREAELVPV